MTTSEKNQWGFTPEEQRKAIEDFMKKHPIKKRDSRTTVNGKKRRLSRKIKKTT